MSNSNYTRLKFFLLPLCFCSVFLAGCEQNSHDHSELVTGKQLFEYHCSSCHKKTGDGNFLLGVPKNKDSELSIQQISHKIISNKEDGGKMPVFEGMSIDEARKISAYTQTL